MTLTKNETDEPTVQSCGSCDGSGFNGIFPCAQCNASGFLCRTCGREQRFVQTTANRFQLCEQCFLTLQQEEQQQQQQQQEQQQEQDMQIDAD